MVMKQASAFTLIEVIIVVVIIGVLAGLASISFSGAINQAANREACMNLEMLLSATEIYKMNNGSYPDTDKVNSTAGINTELKTKLSTASGRQWDYAITREKQAGKLETCVTATRVKNNESVKPSWRLCSSNTAPVCKTGTTAQCAK